MGWLFWYFVAAIFGGITSARIVESLGGFVNNGVLKILSPLVFLGTTTGVTTVLGVNKFNKVTSGFQRISDSLGKAVDSFTDTNRKEE